MTTVEEVAKAKDDDGRQQEQLLDVLCGELWAKFAPARFGPGGRSRCFSLPSKPELGWMRAKELQSLADRFVTYTTTWAGRGGAGRGGRGGAARHHLDYCAVEGRESVEVFPRM